MLGAVHGYDPDTAVVGREARRRGGALGYSEQPYVLVVGGGQGGIALGARLRQLGVPAIVVDKHERPGDQWRKRYKSLCLHDPVWYDHLPYLPFPQNWPVFSPKDKIGDWLEFYTRVMEVPYWSKTTCLSASFDDAAGRWTVEVDRDGERLTLHPAHLVLATGHVGQAERADAARPGRVPRRSTPLQRAPGSGPLRRQASCCRSGRTTRRTTSARRSTRTASTSPWCSGRRRTSSSRTR